MMKNKRLEERRNKIPKDIDIFVKQSFDIVDRIHEILAKQGKEQKDLALLLGKNESEISKWMSGTHNFTINTLARIQAVLGESVIQTTKEKQPGKHKNIPISSSARSRKTKGVDLS
ncbi:MAG TPA: helix-turn-helix transcriptional regulator [Prolixibacteraceae bacterium]|jgi:transcriptional regulator with XRE-family HTH domain